MQPLNPLLLIESCHGVIGIAGVNEVYINLFSMTMVRIHPLNAQCDFPVCDLPFHNKNNPARLRILFLLQKLYIKLFMSTFCFCKFFSCLWNLILNLLVSSTDNHCKQFGPRSGSTGCQARFESKLSDVLIVLLKEFFWGKKTQQTTKKS